MMFLTLNAQPDFSNTQVYNYDNVASPVITSINCPTTFSSLEDCTFETATTCIIDGTVIMLECFRGQLKFGSVMLGTKI